MRRIRLTLLLTSLIAFTLGCSLFTKSELEPFPAGYIDSPYIVPDGSAMYFLHSVVSTLDILEQNASARPVTAHLCGHQEKGGAYWWNSDLYMSRRNTDGTWGEPRNLGPAVNSEHMECCPWVSDDQTVLIFSRESVSDPSLSLSFISRRASAEDPWGEPEPLPGTLGRYSETGYADFHMTPNGNLYFWSEILEGNAALYWAENIGPGEWSEARLLPTYIQSELDETQPWVNDEETVLYFNRRGDDANTQLLRALRENPSADWGIPEAVPLAGFTDSNGYRVWGEPSFLSDGAMFLLRFNTSTSKWRAEILFSLPEGNGGFGTPRAAEFRY